jgi:hypothetical protein
MLQILNIHIYVKSAINLFSHNLNFHLVTLYLGRNTKTCYSSLIIIAELVIKADAPRHRQSTTQSGTGASDTDTGPCHLISVPDWLWHLNFFCFWHTVPDCLDAWQPWIPVFTKTVLRWKGVHLARSYCLWWKDTVPVASIQYRWLWKDTLHIHTVGGGKTPCAVVDGHPAFPIIQRFLTSNLSTKHF